MSLELLRDQQIAEILNIKLKTVYVYASASPERLPPFMKDALGRRSYQRKDVIRWLRAGGVQNSSQSLTHALLSVKRRSGRPRKILGT
ncbi:DNA-binding protein [bacterium]|nr:DNA-binding protein [bacterium]